MLNESVNDKNILKAIIMVGSAGAGKTMIINAMGIGNLFLKVNSDYFFEHLTGGEFDMNDMDDVAIKILDNFRKFAKVLTLNKLNSHIDGLHSIIIDITGSDSNKVYDIKVILESIGYTVYCVYVDVPLKIALERNVNRDRTIPNSVLVSKYNDIVRNIPYYKDLFGSNFFSVYNGSVLSDAQFKKFKKYLYDTISRKILFSKISKRGEHIIEYMKSNKYKYISDFLLGYTPIEKI